MALRPLDFSIPPQRRPSPIEDAFRVALTEAASTLVQLPFANIMERRRLRGLEAESTLQDRLAFESDVRSGKYVPADVGTEANLRAANIDPNTVRVQGRGAYVGRTFFPSQAVLQASQATETIPQERRNLLEGVLNTYGTSLGGRRIDTRTAADIEQTLPEAYQAAQIRNEQTRLGLERQQTKDARLAGLLENVTPNLMKELGSLVDDHGNFLSYSDMGILASASRITAEKSDPFFAPLYTRLQELESMRSQGRLKPIPVLTPDALAKLTTDRAGITGMPSLAYMAYRYNLLWESRGGQLHAVTDLGERGQGAAVLRRDPDLVNALLVSSVYSGMREVQNAEKVLGAAPLSSRTLGYLELIFKQNGAADWQHPRAVIPADIPESALAKVGVARRVNTGSPSVSTIRPEATPGGQGATGTVTQEAPAQPPPAPVAPPRAAAPTVELGASTPTGTQELYQAFYGAIQQDTTNYQRFFRMIEDAHTNPDSAVAFWRRLGATDQALGFLLSPNRRMREAAAKTARREAQFALQRARNSLLRVNAP